MARVGALLGGLFRVSWRTLREIASFQENNFFLVGVVLLLQSGPLMAAILGLALLVPLTANPLRAIPAERLALLPLGRHDLAWLRMISFWMNPVALIAVAAVVWLGSVKLGAQLFFVLIASQLAAPLIERLFERAPELDPARWIPAPPGMLGPLIRKNIREMVTVLDFWIASLLALVTVAYRIRHDWPEPETMLGMSIIIVLAGLGTYAQCLFGLDARAGRTRYRLMPLRGWRILLAKDIAFLAIAVPLTAGIAPLPGLAAALGALAVGHHLSVLQPIPQHRWRFTSGSVMVTLVQAIASAGSAVAVGRENVLWLIPCAAAWAISLWWYGLCWEEAWQDR